MRELGVSATLQFEFLSRTDLGIDTGNDFNSETGIFFLQAGNVTLRFSGEPISAGAMGGQDTIHRTVYCPLILGRPGLLLSQCPALDEDRKDELASMGVK